MRATLPKEAAASSAPASGGCSVLLQTLIPRTLRYWALFLGRPGDDEGGRQAGRAHPLGGNCANTVEPLAPDDLQARHDRGRPARLHRTRPKQHGSCEGPTARTDERRRPVCTAKSPPADPCRCQRRNTFETPTRHGPTTCSYDLQSTRFRAEIDPLHGPNRTHLSFLHLSYTPPPPQPGSLDGARVPAGSGTSGKDTASAARAAARSASSDASTAAQTRRAAARSTGVPSPRQ